jgi:hypothetical protein
MTFLKAMQSPPERNFAIDFIARCCSRCRAVCPVLGRADTEAGMIFCEKKTISICELSLI